MEEISGRAFTTERTRNSVEELPSLLSVVLDINPVRWFELRNQVELSLVVKSICIMLNSHLLLHSSNRVAVLVANDFYSKKEGARIIYPSLTPDVPETRFSANMHRKFKTLDEIIAAKLSHILERQAKAVEQPKAALNTISQLFSMALSYINKISKSSDQVLNSRILVVSISDDLTLPYISTMNCIFAAQKMHTPIDVVKLGSPSVFLQQAADATNGVYQLIRHPKGLVQYLTSAFFIDPSLRSVLILPTDSKIDFRASCFVTNKIINVGYVCSVCLCILSLIPNNLKCPVCDSKFDENVVRKLKHKPSLKRRKIG